MMFTHGLDHLRFPGVLQRIGVCYILASAFYLAMPGAERGQAAHRRTVVMGGLAVGFLAVYWALLKLYPTPGFGPGHLDTYGSLPAVIDRAVFSTRHIYRWGITPGMGPTYDPEGLLSTLPALSNVLFGVVAGELLQTKAPRARQCGQVAVLGTALWLAGLGLSHWLPLNKKLWTSTFALWTSGLAILCLAGLLALVDVRRVRRGWGFFLVFGTNAILAYILSDVVSWGLSFLHFTWQGKQATPLGYLFRGWLQPHLAPKVASLSYALVYVGLVALLIWPLYRRRIFLRI